MTEPAPPPKSNTSWKFSKRDALFFATVASVILVLILGTSERKTKAVPNNDVHQTATSRAQCMQCHAATGAAPQPVGHTRANQCFQCHQQPENWKSRP